MQIGGCLGLGEEAMGRDCLMGLEFISWGDENVLELDGGGGGTTLRMFTLKWLLLCYVNFTSKNITLKKVKKKRMR